MCADCTPANQVEAASPTQGSVMPQTLLSPMQHRRVQELGGGHANRGKFEANHYLYKNSVTGSFYWNKIICCADQLQPSAFFPRVEAENQAGF